MKVNSRRQNNSIEAAEMIKAFMHVHPGSQVGIYLIKTETLQLLLGGFLSWTSHYYS